MKDEAKAKATEQEKTPAKKAPAPGLVPAKLRPLGGRVWFYSHDGDEPEVPPDAFWAPAKTNYGMKDGDCVIFVAVQAKKAILVVA